MAWLVLPGITPQAREARCLVCYTEQKKNVRALDTGIFDDFIGKYEICEKCIREAASLLGLMASEKHEAVKETNRRLLDEKAALLEEIVLLRDALATAQALHAAEEHRLHNDIEKAKVKAIQETEKRLTKR